MELRAALMSPSVQTAAVTTFEYIGHALYAHKGNMQGVAKQPTNTSPPCSEDTEDNNLQTLVHPAVKTLGITTYKH